MADIVGVFPFCHLHEGNISVKSLVILKNKWSSKGLLPEIEGNKISVPSTILLTIWFFFSVKVNVVLLIVNSSHVSTIAPPVSPFGIPKFNKGFSVVPVILAVALLPLSSVVTVPICKFGVAPVSPLSPFQLYQV